MTDRVFFPNRRICQNPTDHFFDRQAAGKRPASGRQAAAPRSVCWLGTRAYVVDYRLYPETPLDYRELTALSAPFVEHVFFAAALYLHADLVARDGPRCRWRGTYCRCCLQRAKLTKMCFLDDSR